jgi:hypothetical protein
MEQILVDLTAAILYLSKQLAAGKTAPVAVAPEAAPTAPAKPVKPAAPAKPAKPAVDTGGHTVESLRDSLKLLLDSKGKDAVIDALARVGATKLSEVKAETFVKLAENIVELSQVQPPATDPFA